MVEELDARHREPLPARIGVEVSGKDVLPMIGELTQGSSPAVLGRPEKPRPSRLWKTKFPAVPPVMCAGCPHRGVFYTAVEN